MLKTRHFRIGPLLTVVIVLFFTLYNEWKISSSIFSGTFGPANADTSQYAWLGLRVASIIAILVFWRLNHKKNLFRSIVFAASLLTLGLAFSIGRLVGLLASSGHIKGSALLGDAAFLAVVNVLTFSIWYWLIDPPGIDEESPAQSPWEFLFPQRASCIPGYEDWVPRYTDYVSLAFYTSVAFSPTDAAPLTRRAKALMIFQAVISLVTITVIAGSAINILASG